MRIARVAALIVLAVVSAGCNVSVAATGDTAATISGDIEWMLIACAFFAAIALPSAAGWFVPVVWIGHYTPYLADADPEVVRSTGKLLGRLAIAAALVSATTLTVFDLGDEREWIGWSVVFAPMTIAGLVGRVYLRRVREDLERRQKSRRN